jgi:hypothetical protein
MITSNTDWSVVASSRFSTEVTVMVYSPLLTAWPILAFLWQAARRQETSIPVTTSDLTSFIFTPFLIALAAVYLEFSPTCFRKLVGFILLFLHAYQPDEQRVTFSIIALFVG